MNHSRTGAASNSATPGIICRRIGSMAVMVDAITHKQPKIKDVLMTTAAVLATVYVLNQIAFTRNLVQKALAG